MKWDEFAFLNQQLAGMLKTGIPLETALRQLCQTMERGELRSELEQLEASLAKGVPLREALAARKFPPLYVKMVLAGIEGNNLPGMLTMLGDHYRRVDLIWTRLKTLMVYPAIVLCTALILFVSVTILFSALMQTTAVELFESSGLPTVLPWSVWYPAVALILIGVGVVFAIAIPQSRDWLNWHLPGFKEAGCSQFASAMRLMLESGTPLRDALGLMQQLERGTLAGGELGRWQSRLSEGHGKFEDVANDPKVFPPLFVWLISQAGEDLAKGFARAADIYQARALHRIEMLLYAALPVTVACLGLIICLQIIPLMRMFVSMLNGLGAGEL